MPVCGCACVLWCGPALCGAVMVFGFAVMTAGRGRGCDCDVGRWWWW